MGFVLKSKPTFQLFCLTSSSVGGQLVFKTFFEDILYELD